MNKRIELYLEYIKKGFKARTTYSISMIINILGSMTFFLYKLLYGKPY